MVSVLQFRLHRGPSLIDFGDSIAALQREPGLELWAGQLPRQLQQRFHDRLHGDFPRWLAQLQALPDIAPERVQIDQETVRVSTAQPLRAATLQQIESRLRDLHPWRKGPYDIHGLNIDTEWRSDWKWQRLSSHITPLTGRRVLDVGCGNGYHCWRMAGAGARLVLGIDPTQLFLAQFLAIRHFLGGQWPVHLLPFGIEDIPGNLGAFDTLFSMGILYHRRSPMDHLLELRGALRPGGELVLETLVIDRAPDQVLVPRGRYAKMRNVWFIPSPATLQGWLERCGFRQVRVVNVRVTSIEEQRATPWMQFESLADFLDPGDPSRTIEGYPAPCRAILLANAP